MSVFNNKMEHSEYLYKEMYLYERNATRYTWKLLTNISYSQTPVEFFTIFRKYDDYTKHWCYNE